MLGGQEGAPEAGNAGDRDTGSDANAHEGAPVAQVLAQVDPVEQALATALERASAAGEWTVVAMLAGELAARRGQNS